MTTTFRPSLTVSLPDDWYVKESITLLAPDGQANVIASSEPLDPNIDTEQYAKVQGDLLREEFPHYHEVYFNRVQIFGERNGYMRRFEWTPPDGVRVTQMQLYMAENGRGYTATATTPSSNVRKADIVLRQVLGQIRFESAPAE